MSQNSTTDHKTVQARTCFNNEHTSKFGLQYDFKGVKKLQKCSNHAEFKLPAKGEREGKALLSVKMASLP